MIVRTRLEGEPWPDDYPITNEVLRYAKKNLSAVWYQIMFSEDGLTRLKLIVLDDWESLSAYFRDTIILKDMFAKNSELLSSGGTITYSAEEVTDWDEFSERLLKSYPYNSDGGRHDCLYRQHPDR